MATKPINDDFDDDQDEFLDDEDTTTTDNGEVATTDVDDTDTDDWDDDAELDADDDDWEDWGDDTDDDLDDLDDEDFDDTDYDDEDDLDFDEDDDEVPADEDAGTEPPLEDAGEADAGTDPEATATEADNRDDIIKSLRKENAARRKKNQALQEQSVGAIEEGIQGFVGQLATDLGLDQSQTYDSGTLTATLSQQIGTYAEQAAEAKRELAVFKAANVTGADIDKLTDSRSFSKRIKDLDASSESYQADVMKLVTRALDKNPDFKAAPTLDRSGGDFTGGTSKPSSDESIEALAERRRKRRSA